MEAATVVQDEQEQEVVAEATRTSAHLFEFSSFVHVGEGAAECEQREDGKCRDARHFHAWLCLPNTLQHNDIIEKGRAAKARRRLAMRDPSSDSSAILESELDDLMRADREPLVQMLAEEEVRQNVVALIQATRAEEQFEGIMQQREEHERLAALPEDERDPEEFATLEKLIAAYDEAVEARITQKREEQRAAFAGMESGAFRDALRESRIEAESEAMRSTTYYAWMGFACTRRCPGGMGSLRMWPKFEDLRNAPPEVIRALDRALDELESRLNRGGAAGN